MFSWIKKQCKERCRIMLAEPRQGEIENLVDSLIQKHGLETPGFDLVKFLTAHEAFRVGEQIMEDNTTGVLLVNKNAKIAEFDANQLIMTNANLRYSPDYKERRRFIVAHEYAHYCLHMEGGSIFAHRDYKHKDDAQEEEADFFARCLLMPRKSVEAVLSTMSENSSVEDKVILVARTFGVTEKKARVRLVHDLKVKEVA